MSEAHPRRNFDLLQSAWGQRLHIRSSVGMTRKGRPPEPENRRIVGKDAFTAEKAGKVGDILDQLSLTGSDGKPVDPADLKDVQTYRDRLKDILKNFSKRLDKQDMRSCREEKTTGGCFLLSPDARATAINGLLRTMAIEENDIGYTVAQSEAGGKVLIIVVVGTDTMNAVSATNLRMCPDPRQIARILTTR